MLGWLKRKAYEIGVASAEKEIVSYIGTLKGMDDDDMGVILAGAQVHRIKMEDGGYIPISIFNSAGYSWELSLEQAKLQQKISLLRSSGNIEAFNHSVCWLHSLRAINMPQIRYLGKEMWVHLLRGSDSAQDALQFLESRWGAVPERARRELWFVPPYLS